MVIMQMRQVELGTFNCGACEVAFSEKEIRFRPAAGHQPNGVVEEILLEMSALTRIDIDRQRGVMCVTGLFTYAVEGHYIPFAGAIPQSRVLLHCTHVLGSPELESLVLLSPEIKRKTTFNPEKRDFAAELGRFNRRHAGGDALTPLKATGRGGSQGSAPWLV